MPEQPRYEPARGGERVICFMLIGVMAVVFLVSIAASIFSADNDFHIIQLLVPVFGIGVAVARLKGWVKQGGGGVSGGGP